MRIVSHQEQPPEDLVGKDDLKLVAYVWGCGDDHCDCTEPVIAWQWRESTTRGRPFYRKQSVWVGTFHSWGQGDVPGVEYPYPDDELAAECARRGIEWEQR